MFIGHIGASLMAPLLALSSFTGFHGDLSSAFAAPKASAEVREASSSFNLGSWNNSWHNWYGNNLHITKIDPSSGPTGTTVTLTGKKFTDTSVVRFGQGTIQHPTVSDDGKKLTFVVPEEFGTTTDITPGKYNVRVQDGYKTSNTVHFEVTDSSSDDPLSIPSIDGPTSLAVGAEGTWTVDVDSDSDQDLNYSVKWGDEETNPLMRLFTADAAVQSSATFTHTYDDPGTYTPEFTVTNEDGETVTKAGHAVVVGDADAAPVITSIDPSSAVVGKKVTITGSGFDSDSTVKLGSTSAASVVVLSDTKIEFTIPSIALSTYAVVVSDNDGTSNAVNLTVTALKGKISINGINAPTHLAIGQEGTWTVKASSNLSGNLSYSVDWGENLTLRSMLSAGTETQSSASFTHSYDDEGTYHPKFTVTDEDGHTATVSASVVVDGD